MTHIILWILIFLASQPERLFVVAPWDDSQHPMIMRYQPGHKAKTHQKIVEDASERVRAEGLGGAAVSAVMRDTGLTHGGFYKHFRSKDDLLVESLNEAFREFADTLVRAAEASPSGEAWKAIVKTWPSKRGQRTSVFCDLFNDDGGN